MIPEDERVLRDTAGAIDAGRAVDWEAAVSDASDPHVAELLRELLIVQGIADLHRSISALDSPADSSRPRTPADTADEARVGSWGPLRLLERIGQGAFGDVYRAWDPRLAREVALKLIRRSDDRADTLGSLAIEEGRLLARVHHPNVVAVYGADRIDGRAGLWMEFVRGRTLEALLREQGPLDLPLVAAIGIDLCRALSAVHHAGMIHLDVKAQNVIRDQSGRTVLMDFGAGREDLSPRPGELAGTPLYLAPEVLEGAAPTPRSDLYSVGVLLYHLVTGGYPVPGSNLAEVRARHAERRGRSLREARPHLPEAFLATVDRALAPDPEQRFGSAAAMAKALEAVVMPARTQPMATPPLGAALTPFRPWVLAAFAIIVAVLTAAPLRTDSSNPRSRADQARVLAGLPTTPRARRVNLPADLTFVGRPSPDGKFISVSDSKGDVALLDLDSGQVRPLTMEGVFQRAGSQYAEFSVVSADSRMVAYTWHAMDGRYELRIVPDRNQRSTVLVRDEAIEYIEPFEWTRDGGWILTLIWKADAPLELAMVSAVDGRIRTVAQVGRVPPRYASVSPDGEFVVYDMPQRPGTGARDIFIVRADGTGARRLVAHPANDAHPVWTPDGRSILFTSDRGGSVALWGVDVVGGEALKTPTLLRPDMGRMWFTGLSQTGSYVYTQIVGSVEVYEAGLGLSEVTGPKALTTTYPGTNISSLWSPDGTQLAYESRRGNTPLDPFSTTIVIRDLRTGVQQEFVPAMKSFLLRAWSPDGRHLLLGGEGLDGTAGPHVWDPVTGAVRAVPTTGTVGRPDWLPDGRLLLLSRERRQVYAHDPVTGLDTVVFDLSGEPNEVLADVMGRGFRLSPDGQTLAYTVTENIGRTPVVVIKTIRAGVVRELARETAGQIRFQDWMADGSALLFTRWDSIQNARMSLWRVSADGGTPVSLGFAAVGLRDLSVHPDGTRITFTAGWPATENFILDGLVSAK